MALKLTLVGHHIQLVACQKLNHLHKLIEIYLSNSFVSKIGFVP